VLQDFNINCSQSSTTQCLKIANATQSAAQGSLIQRIRINSAGAYGFYCLNCTETTIINNRFFDVAGVASVYIDNTQTADVGGNLFQGNMIVQTGMGSDNYKNQGLYLINSGGIRVLDNSIDGFLNDIMTSLTITSGASTGYQIQNNQLDDCATSCLTVSTSTSTASYAHVSIANNVMHNFGIPGGNGIQIGPGVGANFILDLGITGNTIDTLNGGHGIVLAGATVANVTGNTIMDQGGAPWGAAIIIDGSVAGCIVAVNTIAPAYATKVSNGSSSCIAANNGP
jgi:hypothetical protein